jgi:putative endonuclease
MSMSLLEQALKMAPELSAECSFVYMLRLRSGAIYVGCSNDVESRFRDHEEGIACRTTRIDPPVAVVWVEMQNDFSSARAREAQIKKWSRAKKEALAGGKLDLLRDLARSTK